MTTRDCQFSYSRLALQRMYDRGIFKKQVKRTLRRPDRLYTQVPYEVAEYTTTAQVVIRILYQVVTREAPVVVSAIRLGKLQNAYQRVELGTHHDRELDMAYVALLQGKMAETIEFNEEIFCDLDSNGEIMGVELFASGPQERVKESLKVVLRDFSMRMT